MDEHNDHEECADFDSEIDDRMEDYEPNKNFDFLPQLAPYPDSFNNFKRI